MDVPLPSGTRALAVSAPFSGDKPIDESSTNQRNYLAGIVLLLLVVLLWTSSSFLTQDLFEAGFEKPFLVTYLNTSSFSLYLIPFLYQRWKTRRPLLVTAEEDGRGEYESIPVSEAHHPAPLRPPSPVEPIKLPSDLPPLTVRQTASLASIFCFFWFIANWSVNASLDYTTVASSTILASMSGFFTLALGRVFKVETLTLTKLGAVITSFIGVFLVSLSDSTSSRPLEVPNFQNSTSPLPLPPISHAPNPLVGDLLALLSAVFYALYVILLKVRIVSESRINMQLFFGFVGVFNVLSCWPIGLILHFAGMETFEIPSGRKEWTAVVINMCITLSSDYLYVLAMLKTSPLVVTIGLSLTIPLALIGDIFLGINLRNQALFGALLVLLSFVAIGMEDAKNEAVSAVADGSKDVVEEGVAERDGDGLSLRGDA